MRKLMGSIAPLSLLLILAAGCGDDETSTVDSGVPPADAGTSSDSGAPPSDSGTTPQDSGVTSDAGTNNDAGGGDAGMCPEGYAGPNCDQCAPGWQDGNADLICSLACDATGANAPDCGHGTCFIDPAVDMRACMCDTGYVGDNCESCDTGYADPDANGTCERTCMTDCGTHGQCILDMSMNDTCVCNPGYTGGMCDQCASGYEMSGSNCVLDLPDETGLVLWLDADDMGSFGTTQTRAVQSWTDTRAGMLTLLAPSDMSRPQYVPNALNGRAVCRFDGTDDQLRVMGFDAFSGDDYTVFVVYDPDTLGKLGILMAETADPTYAITMSVESPGTSVSFTHRLPLVNTMDSVTGTSFQPSALNVVAARRLTSGMIDHLRLVGWDNGSPNGIMVDDFNIEAANIVYSLRMSLGRDKDDDYYSGDIAEVLVYNRGLMDTELLAVNRYLAAKWGLE